MKNGMQWARSVFVVLVLMGAVGQVQAVTIHDVAADFSSTSNPNGVWSYGFSTTLGSAFTLGSTHGNAYGIDYWVNDYTVAAPSVTHNGTVSPITFSTATWQPGQLGFHPGANGVNCVIRFTTPTHSPFLLDATFSGLDFAGKTTTDVHILLNGVSIFDGIVNGFGAGSGPSFNTTLALNAADTVDFTVGFGQDGTHGYDTTGLAATLTPVPEPSTLILIGLGIPAIVCHIRRHRRREGGGK